MSSGSSIAATAETPPTSRSPHSTPRRARSSAGRSISRTTESLAPLASGSPRPVSSDPLARGHRALAEWDFDGARAAFEEAFATTRSEPAAHALLSLLVEHLALDEDALRLEIPDRLRSARVVRWVAVAAARTGDVARALEHLRRLDGPAEAEVRALLAERAVAERDGPAIHAHLEALRRLDPGNAIVARLEDALASLTAEALGPLECALREAVTTGEVASIRAAASSLLARAPQHPAAKAALAEIEERERAIAVAARLSAAGQQEEAGRLDLALHELEQARRLGADVRAGLDRIRARQAAEKRRAAMGQAAEALGRGDLGPYADLAEGERAHVRARRPDPRLDRLELLLRARIADAVGVLRAAEEIERALASGSVAMARALVERVGTDALVPLGDLVRRVERASAAAAREQARALAATFFERVEAGDDAGAAEVADRLRLDDLDVDRERVETAMRELRARQSEAETVARFHSTARAGAVFTARALALAKDTGPETAWRRRLDVLEARIHRLLPSRVVEPWDAYVRDADPQQPQLSPDACLEPDGQHAWLAEARGLFVFLRRIEVGSSRIVSCTLVRTIAPFTRPRTAVFGDTVVLAGKGARILVLRMRPGGAVDQVVGYSEGFGSIAPLPEYVDPGQDPTPRMLVRDFAKGPQEPRFFLWDMSGGGRSVYAFPPSFSVHPLRRADGRILLVHHQRGNGAVHLYDPVSKASERVGFALRLDAVTEPLQGSGLLCVGAFPPGQGGEHAIALLDAPDRLQPVWRHGLPQWRGPCSPIAPARSLGLVFLLADEGGTPVLRAFDAERQIVFTVSAPGLLHLLTDPESQHVVALFHTERGPVLQPLGHEPPPMPPDPVSREATTGRRSAVPAAEFGVDVVQAETETDPLPGERELVALIDRADREREAGTRFRLLDVHRVWHANELQSLARLASSAMEIEDLPWAQRLHAVAAWHDGKLRHRQHGETEEVQGVARPWSKAELDALEERSTAWLDRAADDLGLLRVSPEDPQWPPPELADDA